MTNKRYLTAAVYLLVALLLVGAGFWIGKWGESRDLAKLEKPSALGTDASAGPQMVRFASSQPTEKELKSLEKMAQNHMADRVRKYASLSPAEKKKYLDEQIDASEAMRKEMGDRLKIGPGTQPGVQVENSPGKQSVVVRRNMNERQTMEDLSPELRAQIAQFTADLRARRAERGLPDQGGVTIINRSFSGSPSPAPK